MKTNRFILFLTVGFFYMAFFSACEKEKIKVDGITLNANALSLAPGETATLIVTIKPDDAFDKTIIWNSDNPVVATVNGEGVVTAISDGNTTITVVTHDGVKTASCSVNVDYRNQWIGEYEGTYTSSFSVMGEVNYDTIYNQIINVSILEDSCLHIMRYNNGESIGEGWNPEVNSIGYFLEVNLIKRERMEGNFIEDSIIFEGAYSVSPAAGGGYEYIGGKIKNEKQ